MCLNRVQQGYGLRLPLVLYARTLRNKQCLIEGQLVLIPDKMTRSHVRIGRLAFWLVLSGICSILSATMLFTIELVSITPRRDNPWTLFALFALFSYFRIGMSYSQVFYNMCAFILMTSVVTARHSPTLDSSDKTKQESRTNSPRTRSSRPKGPRGTYA